MELIKTINLENASEEDLRKIRRAARAIVFDSDGNVALLHATKNFYYKLPGGGLEGTEDPETALKRECMEEIGCNVKILGEVGLVVEYRKRFSLKQESFCYLARLVGEKGEPSLTHDEEEEGFQTVWLPPKEALRVVAESKPIIYEGPYMVARDLALLEAAFRKYPHDL